MIIVYDKWSSTCCSCVCNNSNCFCYQSNSYKVMNRNKIAIVIIDIYLRFIKERNIRSHHSGIRSSTESEIYKKETYSALFD